MKNNINTHISNSTAEVANYMEQVAFDNVHLKHLSNIDRFLFQKFGIGPKIATQEILIHKSFEYHAAINPDGIAVVHEGDEIKFKELDEQANALALALLENKVGPGSNVGLFIQRSIPMVVGILAVLKTGAAYVPQHIGISPEDQLLRIINSASINTVLTLSKYESLVPEVKGLNVMCLDAFIEAYKKQAVTAKLPSIPIEMDDICYHVYTSGTTGIPNGVQVSHRNLSNVLLHEPGNLWMRPGTCVAQLLNIAFDMAAWEILGAMANGATLVIRGKDIEETVRKVDIVIATPTILSTINTDLCKNIKVAAVAGEPCPRTLAEKWSKFCAFYNSCGPTETTIVNTAHRFSPSDEIMSIGKPLPNNNVYILNEHREPCPIGVVGEMWAGGLCVTKGYLNNEELTNKKYLDDPFMGTGKMYKTGDLVRWTMDGTLEHLGRVDDQVKVNGFRVELDAISGIMEEHEDVKRAVTLKYDNQTLISFVSPAHVEKDELIGKLESRLPYYSVPKEIYSLDELPMTARGKVDKRKLLEEVELLREKGAQKSDLNSKIKRAEAPADEETHSIPDLNKVSLPKQVSRFSRLWKGERLMHYYRLMLLCFLANAGIMAYGLIYADWWIQAGIRWDIFAEIAIVNFTVAICIRQQYIINLLFGLATAIPKSWPLSIRRRAGKIYHFGGLHIGGNVSGTLWYLLFVVSLFYSFYSHKTINTPPSILLVINVLLAVLLVFIIVMALPKARAQKHDRFERTHRFGGWVALALFWVQTLFMIAWSNPDVYFGSALLSSASFWLLTTVTLSILLPWLRLKKIDVSYEKPSNHVVLARFNYGETPFAGSSTVLSRNPLLEWHAFANVPEPGREGFRLTISRAGDWTGQLIDDQPKKLWVKGISTAGVGNIDQLFNKVVWIATGSGVGPCLPHLFSGKVPARLVWATRNPRKTYGDQLVDEILKAQPDAVIWDTDVHGKPDMVKLAYMAYKDFDAEAVICISNKKLTWQVVYGMESRGIPAYGAIWDS